MTECETVPNFRHVNLTPVSLGRPGTFLVVALTSAAAACSPPQRFESTTGERVPAPGDMVDSGDGADSGDRVDTGAGEPTDGDGSLEPGSSESPPLSASSAGGAQSTTGRRDPDVTEGSAPTSSSTAGAADSSSGSDETDDASSSGLRNTSSNGGASIGSGVNQPSATHEPPVPTSEQGPVTSQPPPVDECPQDEDQTIGGNCGCGHAPDPACDNLLNALTHRYSFSQRAEANQTTAIVPDLVGTEDALVPHAQWSERGSLLLDGSQCYVQLPAGLLSERSEVTLDLWTTWNGGDENQRLLNFGVAPGDNNGAPDNYLSISPSGSKGVLSVQYRTDENESGDRLDTESPLAMGTLEHLTVVVREDALSLYVNGILAGSLDTLHHLYDLRDADNWLGRALYSEYPLYDGEIFEFRVFGRALNEDEIRIADEVGLSLPGVP